MSIKRSSNALWNGNGKDGKGFLSSASGILDSTPYSFSTRFENAKGTNPEELIAAAHAGCFSMKLAFNLQAENFTADELNTSCEIVLHEGTVTESNLTLNAKVNGISNDKFDELVQHAKENCPISKLLNTKISVAYTLEN